ncbi:MAG: hypothetical protein DRP02_12180 [Candidatus Gerdarchaeota archaeon]|nr:MAG: hypothetical protein DRO63_05855 [Candidatus Gerdarchaeota archaeon]RLI68650.1 MAG: hypothetical protein DRP02_12180 [Candidatus Gerdarchaeota archaeon]
MVKICSHCNAENPDTNVFCFSCGKVLTPSQKQSTIKTTLSARVADKRPHQLLITAQIAVHH